MYERNLTQILLAIAANQTLALWIVLHAAEFENEWNGKLLTWEQNK